MTIDQPQASLDYHQTHSVAAKVHEELGKDQSSAGPANAADDLKKATEAQVKAGTVPALQIVSSMASDIGKGFYQEVTQHPGELIKDAAIGAGTGLVLGLVAPEAAMVAGAYFLGKGAYELATHISGWIHDGTVAADPSKYSASEIAKAHADLQSIGAGTAELAAGLAGGMGTFSISKLSLGRSASETAGADAATGSGTAVATVAGADAAAGSGAAVGTVAGADAAAGSGAAVATVPGADAAAGSGAAAATVPGADAVAGSRSAVASVPGGDAAAGSGSAVAPVPGGNVAAGSKSAAATVPGGDAAAGSKSAVATLPGGDASAGSGSAAGTVPGADAASAPKARGAAAGDKAAGAQSKVGGSDKVATDGILSVDETAKLSDALKADGKSGVFVKPELRPGDPKYYQVSAEQIRLQPGVEHRVSTTESKISVTAQSPLSNGIQLAKGTQLPNGAQLSGRTIITPPEGILVPDRTGEMRFLKTGVQLPEDAEVSGGQALSDKDWVIMRRTSVGGSPGYDVYTPHDESMVPAGSTSFQERWKPVLGEPGQFSPKPVPTEMGFLDKGLSEKIKTSWGTAGGKGPLFLAAYGKGDYNLVTLKDHLETGYQPFDQRAKDLLQSADFLKAKEEWTKRS